MWYIPVAVPAKPAFSLLCIFKSRVTGRNLMIGGFMTALAIRLYRSLAGLVHNDRVWNITHCKHVSVPHAIPRFKSVLFENIVLRHMAVITGRHLPV
jgi:hypothetical protein